MVTSTQENLSNTMCTTDPMRGTNSYCVTMLLQKPNEKACTNAYGIVFPWCPSSVPTPRFKQWKHSECKHDFCLWEVTAIDFSAKSASAFILDCIFICRARVRSARERKPLKKSKQWIQDKKERGRRQGKYALALFCYSLATVCDLQPM